MTHSRKTNSDAEEFLDAVKDVKPIKHNLADVRPMRPRHTQRVPRNRSEDEVEEEMDFEKGGIQRSVLRRLRNGQIRVESVLDLHGYTVIEAERELQAFLQGARAGGRQRAVRVIHGKGIGLPNKKSVLKEKVFVCLRQSEAVLACCVAGPAQGGTGAVNVLLKGK